MGRGASARPRSEKRAAERAELDDERAPLHPMRVYKGLAEVLDRDAIVIGDGGDFVSYAGKVVETYEPGCWMDPGPYGCLGAGPGQAIGAKLAHPDRQVCLLLGDGAFGFSGLEFDTMVRHGIPVVGVIGNNGIWALEHHPMKFLYGYSVAAELRPETRYDQVAEALGCHARAGLRAGRARPGARARVRIRQAGAGQRPHRPRGRLPAQVEPGLGRRALGPAQAGDGPDRGQRHQPGCGAEREQHLGGGADDQLAARLENRRHRVEVGNASEPSPRAGPWARRRAP